jgi:hypothetical protein
VPIQPIPITPTPRILTASCLSRSLSNAGLVEIADLPEAIDPMLPHGTSVRVVQPVSGTVEPAFAVEMLNGIGVTLAQFQQLFDLRGAGRILEEIKITGTSVGPPTDGSVPRANVEGDHARSRAGGVNTESRAGLQSLAPPNPDRR